MINLAPDGVFPYVDPSMGKSKKIRGIFNFFNFFLIFQVPHDDCKPKLDKMKDILINKCFYEYKPANNNSDAEYFKYPKQNASNGLDIKIYSKLDINDDK